MLIFSLSEIRQEFVVRLLLAPVCPPNERPAVIFFYRQSDTVRRLQPVGKSGGDIVYSVQSLCPLRRKSSPSPSCILSENRV